MCKGKIRDDTDLAVIYCISRVEMEPKRSSSVVIVSTHSHYTTLL